MLAMKFLQAGACLGLLSLGACSDQLESELTKTGDIARWYEPHQVTRGAEIFSANCAICHGAKAEGLVPDWRSRLDDGSFPPPPLNGTAHTWHHSLSVLLQVINEGGVALGGQMPGFSSVLTEAEKLSVVAYFQSLWSDDIYEQWQQMGGTN